MKSIRYGQKATLSLILLFICGCGFCDSGSDIDIDPAGTNTCKVRMVSNSDDFTVEATFTCSGANHTDCYQISALTCQGQAKTLDEPLDIDGCPGKSYCIADCNDGTTGGPGTLWDMPELLSVEGCNTYED